MLWHNEPPYWTKAYPILNQYITTVFNYKQVYKIIDESGTAENKEELLFSHDKLSLASILRLLHQVTKEMLV